MKLIEFSIENLLIDSNSSLVWILVTLIQICASLNHHQMMKAEHIRLIPWKLIANLELMAVYCSVEKVT